MTASFSRFSEPAGRALVVALEAPDAPEHLPDAVRGPLARALAVEAECGRFDARKGEHVSVVLPEGGPWRRVIAAGVRGLETEAPVLRAEMTGGLCAAAAAAAGESAVDVHAPRPDGAEPPEAGWAAHVGLGARLRSYRFDRWRTGAKPGGPARVETVNVLTEAAGEAAAAFPRLEALCEATALARDLTNEPANALNPDTFADHLGLLDALGVEMTTIDADALADRGLDAILAVGRASPHRPRLLVMRWRGRTQARPDLAVVGKGITYDTGGLCLKPVEQMKTMKTDMAGAAAVCGLMAAAAGAGLETDLVGVAAIADNALGGAAYRPGDVIRTAAGPTIEITNTDAEGRLALLDALWWVRGELDPKEIFSIGTLGGSGLFGLGLRHAPVYSEDGDLEARLVAAGAAAGEPLWPLPSYEEMDDTLEDSAIADFTQCPDFFVHGADSAYVHRLLRRYVDGAPYAHIEMCRLDSAIADRPTCPKGATGYGVRLFFEYLTGPGAPA
ncbi:hypothetical protein DDZ18_09035 [Marinicauda salina]|uniref:Cytosol aminopeptidase domain-containing protein n=1 Tax=Marinicauda salina TaxID=2135793 RepID=A0A2U2BUW8_9PROT|nr:hypothetical protein [Marinicauda salina]PWE17787.1 hypothetical protein DDZ18_09035 [Marinicauda salina]